MTDPVPQLLLAEHLDQTNVPELHLLLRAEQSGLTNVRGLLGLLRVEQSGLMNVQELLRADPPVAHGLHRHQEEVSFPPQQLTRHLVAKLCQRMRVVGLGTEGVFEEGLQGEEL